MTKTIGGKGACRKVALVRPLVHTAGIVCLGALTVLTLPPFSNLILAPATYGALFLILRGLRPVHATVSGWALDRKSVV